MKLPSSRLGLTVTLGLNSLQSVGQAPGFTFGLGNEYFVTDKFGIRPQVFYSAFSYRHGPDIYEETYVIEIPLHVVMRPFKWKVAPFASMGGSCKMHLPTFDSRLFAEAAIGIDWDFGYGSLAPEFRYSYGKDVQVFYFLMNFNF